MHQRDVGGIDSDVGTGAHGKADVGYRQRRGVVDAVAHHRHAAAGGLLALDVGRLVLRALAGVHLGNAGLGGNGVGGSLLVAGEHHHLHTQPLQSGNGRGRRWPQTVGQRQQSQRRIAGGQRQHSLALRVQRGNLRRQLAQRPLRLAQAVGLAGNLATYAVADLAIERGQMRQRQLAGSGGLHNGLRQRVLGALLQRSGQRQHGVGLDVGQRDDVSKLRLAFGEGAGFVHHQQVDVGRVLQGSGVAEQHAAPRAHADAHHHRSGRGQAERARAGNHQHGHGVNQRLLPIAQPPSRDQ